MKKKTKETHRTYAEMMDDYQKAIPGAEVRRLHKELKDAGYGGLPMFNRYPDFPYYFSIGVLATQGLALLWILITKVLI